MNRSASEIFSLKALAWCWVGLLTSAGAGAMALQLTSPAPVVVVQAAIQPAPVVAPPPPIVASVPFENHSLLAMLPPPAERPLRQAPRVSVPLPVPPVPPAPRVAHLEQHRVVHVYAAERAYAPPAEWAPYANQYVGFMPYAFAAPPSYYGW
jgi:hypothetical protein